ncbi:hypothetical protein TrVE_jg13168 [Triparma verrucosa]|uniref:Uncharacterized protein n=1 Tax=Triparma verrucosa TaxID=1606542 RepID=A0A9W7BEK3_9STRA|nr:hypothetical protein TrVE_jg13168 [Triparma verrucosa]
MPRYWPAPMSPRASVVVKGQKLDSTVTRAACPVTPSNVPTAVNTATTNDPLLPKPLLPLLTAKTVGEELWTTHLLRSPTVPKADDLDSDATDSRRKVSVGEELFNVHLRRESFDITENPTTDEGNKRKASDDNILTAPLEVLCAPTPSPTSKKVRKSARQTASKKEVFTKVSEKVSKTRNY